MPVRCSGTDEDAQRGRVGGRRRADDDLGEAVEAFEALEAMGKAMGEALGATGSIGRALLWAISLAEIHRATRETRRAQEQIWDCETPGRERA